VPATSKATSTSAPGGDVLGGGDELGARAVRASRRCGSGSTASVTRAPAAARDLDQQQPDRAAADHRDVGAEVHVAEVEGVDRHAQRLEHRPGRAVHRGRQQVQRLGRPAEVLAQAAVAVAVAGEDDVRAQVLVALEAARAVAAVQRGVDRDAAPVERAALDHAGELVADHERAGEPRVADPALLVPVQVGAAEADGLDVDEALVRARIAHGLVGKPDVSGAVQAGDRAQLTSSPGGRRRRCMRSSSSRPKWSCSRV
jgi:hypothetical protein